VALVAMFYVSISPEKLLHLRTREPSQNNLPGEVYEAPPT